ncbi:MAG: HTH domain-containing protein [Eubacteriales bacterium]
MSSKYLSIRQRQLLQFLQSQTSYITGSELAKFLRVSPRTIRNDISEINAKLAENNIHISSLKSRGYLLNIDNPLALDALKKMDDSFLSREERVHYLTMQLCLSEIPINLYDLEDEMHVSHTTLEHDLMYLKKKYVHEFPFIQLSQKKSFIEFEKNERKRRSVLNLLIHSGWNYNYKGNILFNYQYIDEKDMNLIINEVTKCLSVYQIQLEDTNLVLLNLSITIMHIRILNGHQLDEFKDIEKDDKLVSEAVDSLFDKLEDILKCSFNVAERNEIYLHISNSRLMDASKLNFDTVSDFFHRDIISVADEYLQKVSEFFSINLLNDEDFYITLLQYIRYLQSPMHIFNMFQVSQDIARSNLLIEYEIAYLFQPFAKEYIGSYLNQPELLYLAFCISGAMEFLNKTIQGSKLKTIICSHLNLYITWSIKRKILASFDNFIDIVALLPINARKVYDFENTDLVITTTNMTINTPNQAQIIRITPFVTSSDYASISKYIDRKRINDLSAPNTQSLLTLLENASWHECMGWDDKYEVLRNLCNDFEKDNYVTEDYLEDLFTRESIIPFAFQPGIVLAYSFRPSTKTSLSVATLDHRIIWNGHKIRTIILAAFHPDEYTLIFKLLSDIYSEKYTADVINHIKAKDTLLDYLTKELHNKHTA